ncbi:MAG: ROK family protein [bacterium]|nr:ROK family protein [bacterium]
MLTLGIDIGASKVAVALVNGDKILCNTKIAYRKKNTAGINRAIFAAVKFTSGKSKVTGIGLGVPCVLGKNNKIITCANIRTLNPEQILNKLRKIYHAPVIIENDVKAASLAELKYGIGRKSKDFVFLAFGTGIGGAIVIDGKLYKGTLGWAGEFGHTTINAKCRMLNAKCFVDWETTSTKQFLRSKKGTADVKKIVAAIAVGLLNITYALAPEYIVIGGGLSSLWDKKFIAKVISKMKSLRLSSKLPLPKIIRSRFGENAGVIGAALSAAESHI